MKKALRCFFQRRVFIPLSALLGLIMAAAFLLSFQPKFLIEQVAEHNPGVFFYAQTSQKVLALTLDDAPDSILTPLILDLLEKHQIQATFFIIGQHVSGNEELINRMKDSGHELGNHMVEDEASIMLSPEEFRGNLLMVEELIGPLKNPKWCRPGSGWFSPEMVQIAHDLGYRICLGSLYPFDNKLRNPDLIRQAVLARIYPGAVLVLHEGGQKREYIIPLLDSLIPELLADGYEFLTLSQLQALDENGSLQPGKPRP